MTPFHMCVAGHCWVIAGKLPPIRIEPDDVIIFPRGDSHVMASEPGIPPVRISEIYAQPSNEQITVLRHGGTGRPARFLCGYLHSDHQFDPLLRSLPAVLCVRSRGGAVALETWEDGPRLLQIEHRQETEWWQASLRYLVSETALPGPGNRAVLARLGESLFVEVLRWQFRYGSQGRGCWLAALHDPQVGRVLNEIQAHPGRAWTVDALARKAAMSRSGLAKRFVDLVGESPMQYLAGWRMHLARDLLREGKLAIGEIAGRVGYESETAFNRAFRRLVGSPPAAWVKGAALRPAASGESRPPDSGRPA